MNYDPRLRRTKIVATLGPSSAKEDVLSAMIEAGLNVVRINSSHGQPEERARWMEMVRRVRQRLDKHVALLVDLQGPRIRVGALERPLELVRGAEVAFAPEDEARTGEIPTTYEALAADVHPGAKILLDDGLLAVAVERIEDGRVHGVVQFGGVLKSHKGINLPNVQVSAPAVTDKDREDVAVALEQQADFIGISFVRRAEDIESVRDLVPPHVKLVAKIEKAAALGDLDRILTATDAVMVARGDLGVELQFEEVPLTQKHLIAQSVRSAKPVITATQMLESMVQHPRPTRAEASDVANAILDGTDAVMLSAETAVGAYPVKAVEAMVRIIHEIERAGLEEPALRRRRSDVQLQADVDSAIAVATNMAAHSLGAPLIVSFTKSGFTARKIAAQRGSAPILGLSTETTTCRFLSLVWGVAPMLADRAPTYDAMLDCAREALLRENLVKRGDRIVVTAGVPFEVPGTTNLLKIETV